MVKLDDRHFIDADEMQYKLVRQYDHIDKKTGKLAVKTLAYCGTVKQVLKAYYRLRTRSEIASMDISLGELLKRLSDACDRLDTLIESIKEV